MTALLPLGTWVPIIDGDPVAAAMYMRHYSSKRSRDRRLARATLQIAGPSNRILLSTPCRRALFVWRRHSFRMDSQDGIECMMFRNEGAGLSSELIRAADAIADQRWPGERHFTFVKADETASRRSRQAAPGQCFIHAGWRPAGFSKRRKLHILERVRDEIR
ncbi:MAG: hypothetical protein K2X76_11850 [Sphingomonas sp.]|nr:hypothetical protein [Sphingomonas sp.]